MFTIGTKSLESIGVVTQPRVTGIPGDASFWLVAKTMTSLMAAGVTQKQTRFYGGPIHFRMRHFLIL